MTSHSTLKSIGRSQRSEVAIVVTLGIVFVVNRGEVVLSAAGYWKWLNNDREFSLWLVKVDVGESSSLQGSGLWLTNLQAWRLVVRFGFTGCDGSCRVIVRAVAMLLGLKSDSLCSNWLCRVVWTWRGAVAGMGW